MTPTPTPTSGEADLPEALTKYLEAQDALDNREYAGINAEPYEKLVRSRNHARAALESALAAGQATAAQQPQGVAYAALPEKYYLAGGEVPTWDEKQMHAFADATHTLRASHGQASAQPTAAGCLQHLTTLQEQAGMYADDFTPQAAQQASAGVTLRSMIEGMSVSVDVSTGDHDAGHRYFGTVTEVMECQGDKHGVTLLVQDAEPNFTATPTAPSTPSSTAQQASAHVLHLVQDAFAEVAMAYPKAFALHKVGLADTAVRKALAAYTPQAADSVQEDAARLDFIERHPEMSLRHRKGRWAFLGFTNYEYEMLPSLRAAIDAASKQGATP